MTPAQQVAYQREFPWPERSRCTWTTTDGRRCERMWSSRGLEDFTCGDTHLVLPLVAEAGR